MTSLPFFTANIDHFTKQVEPQSSWLHGTRAIKWVVFIGGCLCASNSLFCNGTYILLQQELKLYHHLMETRANLARRNSTAPWMFSFSSHFPFLVPPDLWSKIWLQFPYTLYIMLMLQDCLLEYKICVFIGMQCVMRRLCKK